MTRRQRVVATSLSLALLWLCVPLQPGRAEIRDEQIRLTARLPVWFDADADTIDREKSGWLILSPDRRRGYQIMERRASVRTVIQSFDLDTLRPLRRVVIPNSLPIAAGSAAQGGEIVHAVDAQRGRIFLPLSDRFDPSDAGPHSDARRRFHRMLVVDEARFDAGQDDWHTVFPVDPGDKNVILTGRSLFGITFAEAGAEGKLLLLIGANNARLVPGVNTDNVYDHFLLQWDVATGASDFQELLKECRNAPLKMQTQEGRLQLSVLRTSEAIFLMCQAKPQVAQVVGLPLDPTGLRDARPRFVSTLPRGYADIVVDPVAQRLLIRAIFSGETWWVFDAKTRAWAGAIGLTNATGYPATAGLDPESGRFYALTSDHAYPADGRLLPVQGGLFFSDARLTPAPQATNVAPEQDYPGMFRIVVDPETPTRPRRVFVRRGSPTLQIAAEYPGTETRARQAPVEQDYLVFEDTIPVAQPSARADLDKLTADVEERAGVTGTNYGASAAAYGYRVQLVGGASSAVRRELDFGSPCMATERDIRTAVVETAEVSNDLAVARARPLEADDNTRADLLRPASRCWPDRARGPSDAVHDDLDRAGQRVGEESATCTGSENPPRVALESPLQDGHADAACHQDKNAVSAESVHRTALPNLPVRVSESSTKVDVWRDGGVRTKTTAIAKGITIDGVGSIGLVRTEVTTVANGRKKGATSSFSRTICGVHLTRVSIPGCRTDDDAAAFVQQLNVALGTRGRASTPAPDPDLRGTPGGYLAAVQKSAAEEFSDQIINKDRLKAVPGLQIVFFNDDPTQGAGRQIFQFAGVEAASTYGIYYLDGSGLISPDPDPPGGPESEDGRAADGSLAEGGPGGAGSGGSIDGGDGGGSGLLNRLFGRPLLARTLREGLLTAAVWLALGLPVYFATRRSAYLRSEEGGPA